MTTRARMTVLKAQPQSGLVMALGVMGVDGGDSSVGSCALIGVPRRIGTRFLIFIVSRKCAQSWACTVPRSDCYRY
jgi:hypothetical protein